MFVSNESKQNDENGISQFLSGWLEMVETCVAVVTKQLHYDIPNQFVEWERKPHGIRLKQNGGGGEKGDFFFPGFFWGGHGQNKFALMHAGRNCRDQGKTYSISEKPYDNFATGFGLR